MTEPRTAANRGLLLGLGAYGSWGLFPAFFPLLKPAGAVEVLAHRIVWTMLVMLLILAFTGQLRALRRLPGRTWLLLVAATALITVNWGVYIYAVNNSHVLDAALGYFINPLVSVAIGVLLFGERLNRPQLSALVIAVGAVAALAVESGRIPVISLLLAITFGFYGAVKKVVSVDPRLSVGVESALAAPVALTYLIFLTVVGQSTFTTLGGGHVALLVLCGPVTAVPLLMFAGAAQRLPLVTLGLLQYLTPALQMAWGVFVAHEPMAAARWVGFALIWLALIVMTAGALRGSSRQPVSGTAEPEPSPR